MAAVRSRKPQSPAEPGTPNAPTQADKPAPWRLHLPLSWIDSWGGLDGANVTLEGCGALGRRQATSGSAVPKDFIAVPPEKCREFRTFKQAHPLRWAFEQATWRITARLWELPVFVAVDPDDRPLADELLDPLAVGALESAMPERYRLIVPLMRWGNVRWCELAGLRRRYCKAERIVIAADGDVGADHQLEVRSLRGRVSVHLERGLEGDMEDHLDSFVDRGANALVFTHDDGTALDHGRFEEEVWTPALEQVGLSTELDPVDLNACWILERRQPKWW